MSHTRQWHNHMLTQHSLQFIHVPREQENDAHNRQQEGFSGSSFEASCCSGNILVWQMSQLLVKVRISVLTGEFVREPHVLQSWTRPLRLFCIEVSCSPWRQHWQKQTGPDHINRVKAVRTAVTRREAGSRIWDTERFFNRRTNKKSKKKILKKQRPFWELKFITIFIMVH